MLFKRYYYVARAGRKGNPRVRLEGMQMGAATAENSKETPQKLKLKPPYDLAILLGIHLRKPKTLI